MKDSKTCMDCDPHLCYCDLKILRDEIMREFGRLETQIDTLDYTVGEMQLEIRNLESTSDYLSDRIQEKQDK